VPFSPFDVCISLRLGIIVKNVELEDDEGGLVKNLFVGEEIKIVGIVNKLKNNKIRIKRDVNVFYRLYILLGFVVFYFPQTSRSFGSFFDGVIGDSFIEVLKW